MAADKIQCIVVCENSLLKLLYLKIDLYVFGKSLFDFYNSNTFTKYTEEAPGKIVGCFLVILPLILLYQLSQTGEFHNPNNRTKRKNTKGK
jgi:hypothetical protein